MGFTNTDELFSVLKAEVRRYPALRPSDVGTLLYENEFGPELLAVTEEERLKIIEQALTLAGYEEDAELYEFIGNGRYRLNLSAVDTKEYPPERIAADLKCEAADRTGTLSGLAEKTSWVTEHFPLFGFRFSKEDWENYLKEWEEQGFRSPSEFDGTTAVSRGYFVIDAFLRHGFKAEKKAAAPETDRILVRIAIGLALLLLAVGMAALGKYLTGVILK